MKVAAAVALFCAMGGLARYYISGWVHSLAGRGFPYGTLMVNIIGAFLIGVVMEYSLRSNGLSEQVRIGLTVGLLGGLTTFSSFSYETLTLLRNGSLIAASANIFGSVFICLICTWLGILLVRLLC